MRLALLLSTVSLFITTPLQAERTTIAVAANFVAAMQVLSDSFEASSDHDLVVVRGSTGQLYAQILNGAPFDVLLAADRTRPALLVDKGLAIGTSQFTYAQGQLVLWSAQTEVFGALGVETLTHGQFRHLAIASPELAPYGMAARQLLEALRLWQKLAPKIAVGQSVGQAFAMAATQNAELGLVALSQALQYTGDANYAIMPARLHAAIMQDAVLLNRGRRNQAALEFMQYLRSSAASQLIVKFGYVQGDQ